MLIASNLLGTEEKNQGLLQFIAVRRNESNA
jgi:hypothetical protein